MKRIKRTVGILGMSAVLSAVMPVAAVAGETPNTSRAVFHSFTYKGEDDCYKGISLGENQYLNPVLPGWYSDPAVCSNGKGDYFLATSTFSYFPGVTLFHSKDLVNWKQVGHVLTRQSQLSHLEGQDVSGGIFAPALAYNPDNSTYYMITTDVGSGNFLVKTTDPFGEWSDPIYLPMVQGIDPSLFFDTDGKGYIVNNDDAPAGRPEYPGHRTIRVVEFDTKTDKCVGSREIVVNKGVNFEEKPIWCEGPHIYKIDGTYYLMTAEGGTAINHSEVIYKGETPFGPFVPWEKNPILTQRDLPDGRDNAVTCAGHADLVQRPDGSWCALFLACRPHEAGYENLGRETFLMPVEWTDDKWPVITRPGEVVQTVGTMSGAKTDLSGRVGNFSVTDNFTDSMLAPEWFTLRGPATEYYSLIDQPDKLTISCADVDPSEKRTLPMVARRIHHHNFEAQTRMSFNAKKTGEKAGMIVFKDETHHYYLAKEGKGAKSKVVLYTMSPEGHKAEGSVSIGGAKDIDLKVVSDGKTFSFYCSSDKGKTWKTVAKEMDARYTSTASAGGFTGTVIGLMANSKLL